jgi:hypothetical protein
MQNKMQNKMQKYLAYQMFVEVDAYKLFCINSNNERRNFIFQIQNLGKKYP